MKDLNLNSNEKPSLLLENILSQALEVGASDVHLETCLNKMRITFRVDGFLHRVGGLEEPASQRIPTRIKYLAKLKTYLHRQPQDGEISGEKLGFEGYLRVSVYPTVDGEKIALRIFNQDHQKFLLEELSYPPDYLKVLENQLLQPEGLLLFTGPAGSGKTTTIYSALKFILSQGRTNIITIEDPVEFRIPEITQTKVDYAVGLGFPEALRSLLRQDPEVIVIGEIRDKVTAEIAVRAAFTGHLVISTIHAGSVAGTFDRLSEMGLESFLLSRSIRLVTAQRLVRLTCQECGGGGVPVLSELRLS